jgi:putative acetyltransferase
MLDPSMRNEMDADVSAITEVTVAAFKTLEISNHTEQFIIQIYGWSG